MILSDKINIYFIEKQVNGIFCDMILDFLVENQEKINISIMYDTKDL
jgi:hypothetical protein